MSYRARKYARKGSKTSKGGVSKGSRRVAYSQTPNKKRAYSKAFAKPRPSTYKKKYSRSKPKIVNMADGRIVIKHSEFIGDIESSIDFGLAVFELNPGMEYTFPWLARVAQNFEEWSPKSLYFEFRTTSSDALITTAAAPALGQVSMATQYNALDDDFQNNIQLLNYEKSATTKPSRNLRHYVDCRRRANVLDEMYIRTGYIPPNADLRLYDLGKTSISTSGMQVDGATMGQIWVCYEIELRKPKIQTNPVGPQGAAHFQIPGGLIAQSFVAPFGGSASIIAPTPKSTLKSMRLQGDAGSGKVHWHTEDPGKYLFIYAGVVAGGAATGVSGAFGFSTTGPCAIEQDWVHETAAGGDAPENGMPNCQKRVGCLVVKVDGPEATLTFSFVGDTNTGTLDWADVFISRIPDDLSD